MKYGFLKSMQENITLKDVIFSGIPTAGTYSGYMSGYLDSYIPVIFQGSNSMVLIFTVIIFLLILFVLYAVNVEAHKKSLAEILATGYFQNFSGKLASLLKQKADIKLLLPDRALSVDSSSITVEINLPSGLHDLQAKSNLIDETTIIAYLDSNPFSQPMWVKVSVSSDEKVIIHEVPRTLFAIPKYLSGKYTEDKSRPLHKAFNSKFRELMQENSGDIPIHRFIIK